MGTGKGSGSLVDSALLASLVPNKKRNISATTFKSRIADPPYKKAGARQLPRINDRKQIRYPSLTLGQIAQWLLECANGPMLESADGSARGDLSCRDDAANSRLAARLER